MITKRTTTDDGLTDNGKQCISGRCLAGSKRNPWARKNPIQSSDL